MTRFVRILLEVLHAVVNLDIFLIVMCVKVGQYIGKPALFINTQLLASYTYKLSTCQPETIRIVCNTNSA